MSSEASTESDSELCDPLAEELHNVQLVKHVTRENIDALNAKFANLQEPPAMYLTGEFLSLGWSGVEWRGVRWSFQG